MLVTAWSTKSEGGGISSITCRPRFRVLLKIQLQCDQMLFIVRTRFCFHNGRIQSYVLLCHNNNDVIIICTCYSMHTVYYNSVTFAMVIELQGRSHQYGRVSTGPLFEATTTFLPIFLNSVARPADQLAATWPQLTDVEIDGCKQFESDASQSSKHKGATRAHPHNSKMKAKIFSTLRISIPLPSPSSPPYCNRTTSNLMATALSYQQFQQCSHTVTGRYGHSQYTTTGGYHQEPIEREGSM